MTLPTSGAITMAQVATELGVSGTGLNLNSANVRTLAGVASGPIGFSDLYGKANNPAVNYTISLTYDSVSDTYRCVSSGGYGSLTPGFVYKGVNIDQFISYAGTNFQMIVPNSFTFSRLIINGVVLDASVASVVAVGASTSYAWAAYFDAGPFAMSLAG